MQSSGNAAARSPPPPPRPPAAQENLSHAEVGWRHPAKSKVNEQKAKTLPQHRGIGASKGGPRQVRCGPATVLQLRLPSHSLHSQFHSCATGHWMPHDIPGTSNARFL